MIQRIFIFRIFGILLMLTAGCWNDAFAQKWSYPPNQIKGSPVRMMNLINPGIEFSYERIHGNYFSTQLSVAYLTDCLKFAETLNGYSNYRGYRILVGEKYFIVSKRKLRLYTSVDAGFYEARGKNDEWFISSSPGSANEYRESFNFNRKAVMMDAKFGLQFIINHFILDFAFGMGVMFQNVDHTDRKYPNDKMKTYDYPNISDMYLEEGWNTIPNFPLNFKVGFAF